MGRTKRKSKSPYASANRRNRVDLDFARDITVVYRRRRNEDVSPSLDIQGVVKNVIELFLSELLTCIPQATKAIPSLLRGGTTPSTDQQVTTSAKPSPARRTTDIGIRKNANQGMNDVLTLSQRNKFLHWLNDGRQIQACNCLNLDCHQNVADGEDSNTPEVLILVMNALGYSDEEILCHKQSLSFNDVLKKTFGISDNLLISGSISQGFGASLFLGMFKSDMDLVYINDTIQVISYEEHLKLLLYCLLPNQNINDIQALYRVKGIQELLRIEEDPQFPGYVKLLHVFPSKIQYFSSNEYRRANQTKAYKDIQPDSEGTNGPAHTLKWNYHFTGGSIDWVPCLEYKAWPDVVHKWSERSRPYDWPSKEIIQKIKQEGCYLAPVGHFDSKSNDIQWRLSLCGENLLFSELKPVQFYCFVALRLIIKGDISRINEDIISSFHIKNVIFWCSERSSCAWEVGNFENCLKACIKALTKFVSSGKLPSYFIVGRNLFNSKMTSELSSKILNLLQKYSNNIYEFLSLDKLSLLKNSTQYKRPALELAVQKSVIHCCICVFSRTVESIFVLHCGICRGSSGMNILKYLQKMNQINRTLKSEKQHYLRRHILRSYIHSILGLLNYACYKTFRQNEYLHAARKHVVKSMTFSNIALMCRAATFFLMESDFEKCLKICTAFFNYPVKQQIMRQFDLEFYHKVCLASYNLIDESDLTLLKIRKKQLMSMFFCTGGQSCCFHISNYKTILENLTYIILKDIYFQVIYAHAESQALPEVIQFELNSLSTLSMPSKCEFFLSPVLNCSLLAFLCYREKKNYESRDEVLNRIDEYFVKCQNPLDCHESHPDINLHHEPIHQIANIAAYCHLKATHYRKASKLILESMTLFPSKRNAAYGYIKCVVQSLNSV